MADYDYSDIKSSSLFDISGKVALITGGSSGLGLNMAHGLCANGIKRVYISSRKQKQCDAAVAELKAAYPGSDAVAIACDASSGANLAALAREIGSREPGGINAVFANSGATWGEAIDTHPESAFSKVMDLNVKGVFYTIQAFLPLLEKAGTARDHSRIVVTGSVAGLKVNPSNVISYSASKVGAHALVQNLAPALGQRKISICAISPGLFPSKMTSHVYKGKKEDMKATPTGRDGEARDIIALSLFLMSPGASYVSGAVIPLDGAAHLNPFGGDWSGKGKL